MIKIVEGPFNYFDLVIDDLQSKGFVIGFEYDSLNKYLYNIIINYDEKTVDMINKAETNPCDETVSVKLLVKEAAVSHRDLFAVFVGDNKITSDKLVTMLTKRGFTLVSGRDEMAIINFECKTVKFVGLDDMDELMEPHNIAVLPIKVFKHVLKKLFVKQTSEMVGLKIDELVGEVIGKLGEIESLSSVVNNASIQGSCLSAVGQVKSISKKTASLQSKEVYMLKDGIVFNEHIM